jgi:hypothetical protein
LREMARDLFDADRLLGRFEHAQDGDRFFEFSPRREGRRQPSNC